MISTIATERLQLRPFDLVCDLPWMDALTDDAETMRYLAHGHVWTQEETAAMMARHAEQYPAGLGFCAMVEMATGIPVGWAGLQNPKRWMSMVVDSHLPEDLVEVGWALAPAARGRGYATEAARGWLAHGFDELGLNEIVAVHSLENLASERVMDRLGMQRREVLPMSDGDDLCLHVTTRTAWSTPAERSVDAPASGPSGRVAVRY